jgi:hypothetical protein
LLRLLKPGALSADRSGVKLASVSVILAETTPGCPTQPPAIGGGGGDAGYGSGNAQSFGAGTNLNLNVSLGASGGSGGSGGPVRAPHRLGAVETDRLDLDANLGRARSCDLFIDEFEDFGSSGLCEHDGAGHGIFLR